jgi:hypothetical protein
LSRYTTPCIGPVHRLSTNSSILPGTGQHEHDAESPRSFVKMDGTARGTTRRTVAAGFPPSAPSLATLALVLQGGSVTRARVSPIAEATSAGRR